MKQHSKLPRVFALALPFAAATAPQWTTNKLPPGLIAGRQAEANALDSAGTQQGSGSTMPAYAPGRCGQAFQFNGMDVPLIAVVPATIANTGSILRISKDDTENVALAGLIDGGCIYCRALTGEEIASILLQDL